MYRSFDHTCVSGISTWTFLKWKTRQFSTSFRQSTVRRSKRKGTKFSFLDLNLNLIYSALHRRAQVHRGVRQESLQPEVHGHWRRCRRGARWLWGERSSLTFSSQNTPNCCDTLSDYFWAIHFWNLNFRSVNFTSFLLYKWGLKQGTIKCANMWTWTQTRATGARQRLYPGLDSIVVSLDGKIQIPIFWYWGEGLV